MDANDSCINAEIRTRIPDIIPHDYVMEDEGGLPTSFAVKVFSRFILSFGWYNLIVLVEWSGVEGVNTFGRFAGK